MASAIDLDRVRRNDDRLSTLQLILSATTAVNLPVLKDVLRMNTKVSEVIVYVDESFLVELPAEEVHDLFRTIGGMPNLQKVGFHSQSGSSGVLSVQALVAITSRATRMVHFGISDVALSGTRTDFEEWATELQSQLFLQSFCVCECELLEGPTHSSSSNSSTSTDTQEEEQQHPFDFLLTVLSILPSLEALFLQAANPNALGPVSPESVGAIGMAQQLQDLRFVNFLLTHAHMEQLAAVLKNNRVLTELKLDTLQECQMETAVAMANILKGNTSLKTMKVGFTSMMTDDCAEVVARSLTYNPTLESFTLSRSNNARFRPTISPRFQQAFVEMLRQNFVLETLVLFQRFPVKREFKLYLTLNKYGRGKLLMNHSTTRAQWIDAIHKVNDNLDSIFYYLSINPNLCSPAETNQGQEDDNERLLAAAAAASSRATRASSALGPNWENRHGPSDRLVPDLANVSRAHKHRSIAALSSSSSASLSSSSSSSLSSSSSASLVTANRNNHNNNNDNHNQNTSNIMTRKRSRLDDNTVVPGPAGRRIKRDKRKIR